MNNNKYKTAGWLSIANAVLTVPTIALGFLLEYVARSSPVVNILQILLSILFCALGVYILYVFKDLLNTRYQFHIADNLILTLIWINIIFTITGLPKYLIPDVGVVKLTLDIIGVVLFYLMGIITVIFGIRLLKIKDDLFGLLKPFAYMNIVSGVFIMSILLLPFGLLAAVTAYIIQGIIFLRAAEDLEFV
jgi:hypothetical protein